MKKKNTSSIVDRRQFMKKSGGGLLGAAILADPFIKALEGLVNVPNSSIMDKVSLSYELMDNTSILSLKFYFFNVKNTLGKNIKRDDESTDSFMLVRIPQQHITEQVIEDTDILKEMNQLASYISGYSYLSFKWPSSLKKLPIDVQEFMNWERFELLCYDRSIHGLSNELGKNDYPLNLESLLSGGLESLLYPGSQVPITLIENPYKLILTPVNVLVGDQGNGTFVKERIWANNNYSTRLLFMNPSDGLPAQRTNPTIKLTEIWSSVLRHELYDREDISNEIDPHYKIAAFSELNGEETDKIRLLPGKRGGRDQRFDLACLTEYDVYDDGNNPILPDGNYASEDGSRDVVGKRNELTALGASTRFKYWNLDIPKNLTGVGLVGWKQFTKYGRDNYVEIAEIGVDANTGLKCVFVETAEREIDDEGRTFLKTHYYIRFVDKKHTYDKQHLTNVGSTNDEIGFGYSFRNLPFKKIKVLTQEKEIFPKEIVGLNRESEALLTDLPDQSGATYFNYLVTDYNNNEFEISMPVAFIFKKAGLDVYSSLQGKIFSKMYVANGNQLKYHTYLSTQLTNQKVAFAEWKEKNRGDKSNLGEETNELKPNELIVSEIAFYYGFEKCVNPNDCGGGLYYKEFSVFPQMRYVKAEIPQLMGISDAQKTYCFRFSDEFISKGFNTFSQVFLETLDGSKLGGVRSINLSPKAIKNVFTDGYRNTGKLMNSDLVIDGVSTHKQALGMKSGMRKEEGVIKDTSTKMVDPGEILRGLNSEIIGGIDLKDILSMVLPLGDMPSFEVFDEVKGGFKVLSEYQQKYNELRKFVEGIEKEIHFWEADLRNHADSEQKRIADKLKAKQQLLYRYKISLDEDFSESQKNLKKEIEMQYKAAHGTVKTYLSRSNAELTRIEDQLKPMRAVVEESVALWTLMRKLNELGATHKDTSGKEYVITNIKRRLELRIQNLKADQQIKISNQFRLITKDLDKVLIEYSDQKEAVAGYINQLIQGSLINVYEIGEARIKGLMDNSLFVELKAVLKLGSTFKFGDKNIKAFHDLLQEINREDLPIDGMLFKGMMREIGKDLEASYDYIRIKERQVREEMENLPANFGVIFEVYKENFAKAHELQSLHEFVQERIQLGRQKLQELDRLAETTRKNFTVAKNAINAKLEEQAKQLIIQCDVRLKVLENDPKLSVIKDAIADYRSKLIPTDLIHNPEKFKELFEQKIEGALRAQENELLGILDAKRKEIEDILKAKRDELVKPAEELRDFIVKQIEKIRNELLEKNQRLVALIKEGSESVKQVEADIRNLQNKLNLILGAQKKEVNYTWNTNAFSEVDLGVVQFIPKQDPKTKLELDVKNTIHFDLTLDRPPKVKSIDSNTVSRLTNFDLNFLQMITVSFNEVSFVGGTNTKEKFDVKIGDVKFDGIFNFVEIFQEWLQTVDKGLILDVNSKGAELTYLLPIPNISAGAFNFAFAKLSMGLNIYCDPGKPMLFKFGMNHPKEMFLVSAGIFGGRGCFLIGVEPGRGVVEVLLVIEFGGVLYLNLGVANGMVYLFAGIYMRKRYDKVELRGYLTCGGALRIIGLVTASVTFYMGLHGTGDGRNLKGVAKASYKVKIGRWFERRVTMEVKKQIKGASSSEDKEKLKAVLDGELNLVKSKVLIDQLHTDADKKFDHTEAIVLNYLAPPEITKIRLDFEQQNGPYKYSVDLLRTKEENSNDFYLESPFTEAMIGLTMTVCLIEVNNEQLEETIYIMTDVRVYTGDSEERRLQSRSKSEWKEYLESFTEL